MENTKDVPALSRRGFLEVAAAAAAAAACGRTTSEYDPVNNGERLFLSIDGASSAVVMEYGRGISPLVLIKSRTTRSPGGATYAPNPFSMGSRTERFIGELLGTNVWRARRSMALAENNITIGLYTHAGPVRDMKAERIGHIDNQHPYVMLPVISAAHDLLGDGSGSLPFEVNGNAGNTPTVPRFGRGALVGNLTEGQNGVLTFSARGYAPDARVFDVISH